MCRRYTSVTKQQVLDEIQASLGKKCTLTDFALRKLIKAFADNKGGRWVFRGDPIEDQ